MIGGEFGFDANASAVAATAGAAAKAVDVRRSHPFELAVAELRSGDELLLRSVVLEDAEPVRAARQPEEENHV